MREQPYLEPVLTGLERGWEPLPEGPWRSPSLLLQARHGVVPFRGRQAEIEDLERWCGEGGSSPVRLLVGGAGRGKSRLAIELCRRLAARGWLTGFLSSKSPADVAQRVLGFEEPALLVIDYAETRSNLEQLLEALAQTGGTEMHVRVLLLARSAGDWWQQLLVSESADLRLLLASEEPRQLYAVDDRASDRAAAFMEAAQAFAEAQAIDPQPWAIGELSGSEFEAILHVHMSALDAVGTWEEPGPGPGAKGQVPVLMAMRLREASYWRRSALAMGLKSWERELAQVVAMATLVGAADENSAAELLRRVPALRADAMDKARRDLAHWHHDIYPGGEWLEGLHPDALGEDLVAHVLQDAPGLAVAALDEPNQPRMLRALTVLDRMVRGRPRLEHLLSEALRADLERLAPAATLVAIQSGDPIGRLLAEALETTPGMPEALEHLYDEIPEKTVALRETGAALARGRVARVRAEGSPMDLARSLNNLSNSLSALGRKEEALAAIEEAVKIRRQLAKAKPDAFLPELAGSLHNLSLSLSELAMRREALAAIEEAVKIRRQLAEAAWPDPAFWPDLALSLSNLSGRLSEFERREEALRAIEGAVRVYRLLADARPDAFLPELAMSLNNLGGNLAALGMREEALAANLEAVKIRRELAEARPDAILPDLAMSLNNLSISLSELGMREDALEAIEEAVKIRRQLAEARPDAFLPDLAMSLNNLSTRLSRLGMREGALEAIEEAVKIRRQLAKARPDAFLPDLGGSLNNLSSTLSALGRVDEALEAIEEAMSIYEDQAAAEPDVYLPYLAMSLNNLSGIRWGLGRKGGAVEAIQEAVNIRRKLAEARPDAFLPDLAMSLSNLSTMQWELGRGGEALEAIEEAVRIRRELAARWPAAFGAALVLSLRKRAAVLDGLGRSAEAEASRVEAASIMNGG